MRRSSNWFEFDPTIGSSGERRSIREATRLHARVCSRTGSRTACQPIYTGVRTKTRSIALLIIPRNAFVCDTTLFMISHDRCDCLCARKLLGVVSR